MNKLPNHSYDEMIWSNPCIRISLGEGQHPAQGTPTVKDSYP